MCHTQYTPDFFVSESYGLRNTTSLGSYDIAFFSKKKLVQYNTVQGAYYGIITNCILSVRVCYF
jgi:hypothetical protein